MNRYLFVCDLTAASAINSGTVHNAISVCDVRIYGNNAHRRPSMAPARQWYQKAADAGNEQAKEKLGKFR